MRQISKNRNSLGFYKFAAIDFETADYGADSACAVSVLLSEKGKITRKFCALIRPPRRDFVFSYLHGITWEDVADQPVFGEIWPRIRQLLEGVEFVAAHNASFDRRVLQACCGVDGVFLPELRFLCTMKLARRVWRIYPTKLSDVCRYFRIPLKHHDAASDALACAKIVLKTGGNGLPGDAFL